MTKKILWNIEKSIWLKDQLGRGGIGFEECAILIEAGEVLDIIQNPSANFPEQSSYVLNIEGYAYCVPFVESKDEIFLKKMYPSRRLTAFYLDKKKP